MEKFFQHGLHNRPRRRGAETALFRKDGNDDARMIIGRISDKPAVIAAAEVFRRPRLAGYLYGKTGKEGTCRTRFLRNVAHAFANQIEGRLGHFQRAHLLGRKYLIRRTVQVIDAADNKRSVLNASVGYFTDHYGCL